MAFRLAAIAAFVLALTTGAAAVSQTADDAVGARNAEVIRRHHEAISRGAVSEAAAMYADHVLNNGNLIDRGRLVAIMQDNATTFPDWTMTIESLVADGDHVAALIRVAGTHLGISRRPVNGGLYLNVPPTGKRFSVLHTHWFRLKDGQIVEHRATRDDLGMSRQLGLLPPGPPRPPT